TPIDDHDPVEQRRGSGSAIVVGMAMRMPVPVPVHMRMPDPGAAHMMVMALLRRADRIIVSDHARAVLAQLTVHRRRAGFAFVDAVEKGVNDFRMVAQIEG